MVSDRRPLRAYLCLHLPGPAERLRASVTPCRTLSQNGSATGSVRSDELTDNGRMRAQRQGWVLQVVLYDGIDWSKVCKFACFVIPTTYRNVQSQAVCDPMSGGTRGRR